MAHAVSCPPNVILICTQAQALGSALAAEHHCPELTTVQIAAGYVNGVNFIKVLGIGAISGGFACVFWGAIKQIVLINPEALAWTPTIGGLLGTHFIPVDSALEPWRQWTLGISALLLPCAIGVSAKLRNWPPSEQNFARTLTLVWGVTAMHYDSTLVGYLAVGALQYLLGFTVVVAPFSYTFGYESDDALLRGTAAGVLLATTYGILKAAKVNIGPFECFSSGALHLGSFAAGLGMLILSSRWYRYKGDTSNYLNNNALAVLFLGGGTFLSLIFGVKEMTTITSAFLLFYIPAKIIEIPTDDLIAVGFKIMAAGGVLAGAWNFLHTHQELAMRYLTI